MLDRKSEIERSIIVKYRKEIWRKFTKAVRDYELVEENDKIAVCISGGKDSFLLAKCLEELKKHGKVKFDLVYLVMNPGYSDKNYKKILENAKILGLDLNVFNSSIFSIVDNSCKGSPCYLCARMRRGFLYARAKELGCNKIALGHHFDDVIETTLLSMFYGSEIKTMMPKLHSDNFEGLELIRPLYLIKESAVLAWKKYNELTFINCACRFTENCSIVDDGTSKRKEMKNLVDNLRKINPSIDNNIFTSMNNINLNCVLGTKKDGKYTSFLDNYDNK